ncbi:phosphatidylinositol-specific phospholipase C1-like protein [Mucilaginibacter sp. RS28]|uniref:Phosphatidylinositol-specific phospholipase C1-like protein n=1 Tax=Mucilaginibacter straminoryzae TaxID=2932774 RepID=A0A9X1X1E8_9SPHI|nr:phosphatidylinositol-specific phospholipase C1-like protein [Mucilaginibacter straminoryzae]MCJ8208595.1 phosphatidylinositol-specific phospholipase C1-like protein [Mucilaginibacter straminoryzae]
MKNYLSMLLIGAAAWLKTDSTDNLPINKIQVIGSHNSYKKAIDPALFKVFQQMDPKSANALDYEHIPIIDQLNMGLQNLEIDIYSDEKGGRYAHPKGLDWVKNQPPYDEQGVMKKPGFKILHVPELDFRSDYLTFSQCLKALRAWSDAHPDHGPVFITLEPKDSEPKNPTWTKPEPFTEKTFDQVDSVILADLGREHLITPDLVRGKHKTLNEAITHNGWPTVKAVKGKFAFILDDKKEKMQRYIAGHHSLKGRVVFANAPVGTPEAAMMIINDPQDPSIPQLVKQGYFIRTRADSDTKQARTNDRTDFTAACNSGAQIITTDYYLKSTHFPSDYSVSFEGGKYVRPNPVLVPHPNQ